MKLIILCTFVICISAQQIWSQEVPKLAAFAIYEKAPANTTVNKTVHPEMSVWGIQEPNKNNSGSTKNIIPELKSSKLEVNKENSLNKSNPK